MSFVEAAPDQQSVSTRLSLSIRTTGLDPPDVSKHSESVLESLMRLDRSSDFDTKETGTFIVIAMSCPMNANAHLLTQEFISDDGGVKLDDIVEALTRPPVWKERRVVSIPKSMAADIVKSLKAYLLRANSSGDPASPR